VIGLSLYDCEIKQIPECLCSLIYLQELYLLINKIKKGSDSFAQLQNLNRLYLQENQLQELPAWNTVHDNVSITFRMHPFHIKKNDILGL